MHCYSHDDRPAVGVCKSCGKAICRECVKDLGFAVCCSETCATEAGQLNEMNQRGKRIYGITGEQRGASQATAYMTLGGFLCLFGFLFYGKAPMLTYFASGMGLLMVLVGFFIRKRMKSLGIQM